MHKPEYTELVENDNPETWPEPTESMPDEEALIDWFTQDSGCEATDGCWVEADGYCSHGHPSWLLVLGMI